MFTVFGKQQLVIPQALFFLNIYIVCRHICLSAVRILVDFFTATLRSSIL